PSSAARRELATVRASGPRPRVILLVGDLLHPVDVLAVELFRDGDVRHRRRRCRPVPVLFPRRTEDHVTGEDFLDGPAPAWPPPPAGRHDQRLAERVRVPCRVRSRFERDAGASDALWVRRVEEWIDPDRAGEVLRWSAAG